MQGTRSVRWAIAAGMIGAAALASGAADDRAPDVPDLFLLRPSFETTRGEVRAGTAFAVALPGRPRAILLTALHLLGEAGGLKEEVAAKDVPEVLKGLVVTDPFDKNRPPIHLGDDVASIPESAPFRTKSKAGDIVAFFVPADVKLPTKPLATKPPAKGARVWLAADVLGGAPKGRRLHPAKVLDEGEGLLLYEFDDAGLELRATSGAPVLNAAGEVVAINLASGKTPEGTLFGAGNPATRFRPFLEAAVANGPR